MPVQNKVLICQGFNIFQFNSSLTKFMRKKRQKLGTVKPVAHSDNNNIMYYNANY